MFGPKCSTFWWKSSGISLKAYYSSPNVEEFSYHRAFGEVQAGLEGGSAAGLHRFCIDGDLVLGTAILP